MTGTAQRTSGSSTCKSALQCVDTAVVGERLMAADVWGAPPWEEAVKRLSAMMAQATLRALPCDRRTGRRPIHLMC